MTEFKITSMRGSNRAPRNDGSIIRAHFDCEIRGMRIVECQIIERPCGKLSVIPPMVKVGRERFRAIKFEDPALSHSFFYAAMAAFEEMDGIDGRISGVSDDIEDSLSMAGINR